MPFSDDDNNNSATVFEILYNIWSSRNMHMHADFPDTSKETSCQELSRLHNLLFETDWQELSLAWNNDCVDKCTYFHGIPQDSKYLLGYRNTSY